LSREPRLRGNRPQGDQGYQRSTGSRKNGGRTLIFVASLRLASQRSVRTSSGAPTSTTYGKVRIAPQATLLSSPPPQKTRAGRYVISTALPALQLVA